MLTEAELAEMLEIRRKIDALQTRYQELATKMAGAIAPAVKPAAPAPAPAAAPAKASPSQTPAHPAPAPAAASTAPLPAAVPVAAPTPPAVTAQASTSAPAAPGNTQLISAAIAASLLPKDPSTWALKDYVIDVVGKAGKPLSFEEVYKRLEAGKAPLPGDKPKLIVRQILYNRSLFQVNANHGFTMSQVATLEPAKPSSRVSETQMFKYRVGALLGKK